MKKLNFSGLPKSVIRELTGDTTNKEVVSRFKDFILSTEPLFKQAEAVARDATPTTQQDQDTLDDFILVLNTFNTIRNQSSFKEHEVQLITDFVTSNTDTLQKLYALPTSNPKKASFPQQEVDLANLQFQEILGSTLNTDISDLYANIQETYKTTISEVQQAPSLAPDTTTIQSPISSFTSYAKSLSKETSVETAALNYEIEEAANWYKETTTKEQKIVVRNNRRDASVNRKMLQHAKSLNKNIESSTKSSDSLFSSFSNTATSSLSSLLSSFTSFGSVIRMLPGLIPMVLGAVGLTTLAGLAYHYIFGGDISQPLNVPELASSFGLAASAMHIIKHPIKTIKTVFKGVKSIIKGLTFALSKARALLPKVAGLGGKVFSKGFAKTLGPLGYAYSLYDGVSTLWSSKKGQGFFSGGLDSRAVGYGSSIAGGAALGATVGSVVPVLGTAVGGFIGGAVGGISALVADNKDNIKKMLGMQDDIVSNVSDTMEKSQLGTETKDLTTSLLEAAKAQQARQSPFSSPTQAAPQTPTVQSMASSSASSAPAASGSALNQSFNLLRQYEGFTTKAGWDVNHYRLGYGSDTITRADGSVVEVQKGMTVTKEDAERDLLRRTPQFMASARQAVGAEAWDRLPPATQAVLTSVSYNYGSLYKLKGVLAAARSGDNTRIAAEVRALQSHNGGVNRRRRNSEADYILANAGQVPTAPMQARKTDVPIQQASNAPAQTNRRKVAYNQGKTTLSQVPFLPTDNRLVGSNLVGLKA